jgi:hypothetical protein
MLVNIDIAGDILLQAETDFERDYVRQFEGATYNAFVKCGLTPAEVIGLKLRKTSESKELAATDSQQRLNAIADVLECLCQRNNLATDPWFIQQIAVVRNNCT